MTTNDREVLDDCLQQITTLSPTGSLEPLGERIIDLLWSVSEARPDIDALPIIISEHEESLRSSCRNGNAQQAGQSVCAVLDKIARRTPSQVRDGLRSACGMIERAFEAGTPKAVADGLHDAVKMLVDEKQTGGTLPVFVEGDSIRIGRHFKVTFCRTLRIPDNGRTYPLPAGLGHFPLHAVADYADRVPREWLETGGFFLPMYQSEAMYLQFEGKSWNPNIAKVGVGRINAVTGKAWNENISSIEQDYLLCPHQKWLDGINAGKGFVRQFVAMPLGKGYTVEEQVTDECVFGGIQIVAFAAKAGMFPEIDPEEIKNAKLTKDDADLLTEILKLPPPYQRVLAMHVLKYPRERILEGLEASESLVVDYENKAKRNNRTSSFGRYRKGDGKKKLLRDIEREGLNLLEPLVSNKEAYSRLEQKIFPSDIRFRRAGSDDIRFRRAGSGAGVMGLAAGGRLKQKILSDPFGSGTWDPSIKGSVTIHLVDSKVYRQITGRKPPTRPITSDHYQKLGIPWYNYYNEQAASVAPSHILSRIKSVFAIDEQRGKPEPKAPNLLVDPAKICEIKPMSREERINSLLSATKAAAKNGALKSVIRLTTSILDLQHDFVPVLRLRGEVNLRLGYYTEAQDDANNILKLSDSKEDALSARSIRARVALQTGKPEAALLEAETAIRVMGKDPELETIAEKARAILNSRK